MWEFNVFSKAFLLQETESSSMSTHFEMRNRDYLCFYELWNIPVWGQ
jgi:hypothetical protein